MKAVASDIGVELSSLLKNNSDEPFDLSPTGRMAGGRRVCCKKECCTCCSRRTKVILSAIGIPVGTLMTLGGIYLIPQYKGFPGWQLGALIFSIVGLAITILSIGCFHCHAKPKCADLRCC